MVQTKFAKERFEMEPRIFVLTRDWRLEILNFSPSYSKISIINLAKVIPRTTGPHSNNIFMSSAGWCLEVSLRIMAVSKTCNQLHTIKFQGSLSVGPFSSIELYLELNSLPFISLKFPPLMQGWLYMTHGMVASGIPVI